MVDSKRFEDWFDKAERDLKSAKVLMEHDCGNDMVAFHSQQAIEKSLKAFLLKKTGKIVEGHSLIYLCKEASNYIPQIRNHIKDCAFVNQYYIETRYPADNPIDVSEEEATECIQISEVVNKLLIENI